MPISTDPMISPNDHYSYSRIIFHSISFPLLDLSLDLALLLSRLQRLQYASNMPTRLLTLNERCHHLEGTWREQSQVVQNRLCSVLIFDLDKIFIKNIFIGEGKTKKGHIAIKVIILFLVFFD